MNVPRSVVFTFTRTPHPRFLNTALDAFAGAGEFASCMRTVVAASDDAFFGAFLFSQLSDKLTRFEFEDVRF